MAVVWVHQLNVGVFDNDGSGWDEDEDGDSGGGRGGVEVIKWPWRE